MEVCFPLAQIFTQKILGSLRTLYQQLNSPFIPHDLRSLVRALEQISSKKLDGLLELHLEKFSRTLGDARCKTVRDCLHVASDGLDLCIEVLTGMSVQDTWTNDNISVMNYGWGIFNHQMSVVVKLAVVEEVERCRFHPFTDRSKVVVLEPDAMSVASSSYKTIDSMPFQTLQRPTTIKQPKKKGSKFFGLGNSTTTTLPAYTERPEVSEEAADEEIPRKLLDEKDANEKPRRFFNRKGNSQANGAANLRRAAPQTGPTLVSSDIKFDINMEKSTDGSKMIVDVKELSTMLSGIQIKVTESSASGPVQVLPVFFQPIVHDRSSTPAGSPSRITKRQTQPQAARPLSLGSAQITAHMPSEGPHSAPNSSPITPPLSPQDLHLQPTRPPNLQDYRPHSAPASSPTTPPLSPQNHHPQPTQPLDLQHYRPQLPPRPPSHQVTAWPAQPTWQTISSSTSSSTTTSPPRPPPPIVPPHPLMTTPPSHRPGLRESILRASMNSALDLLHPGLHCPCGIRHAAEAHAGCPHCLGHRCVGYY